MDSTTLAAFRHSLYTACFTRARDALFDLTDALVSDPQARSFVELSQAACFQRAWPSLYAALADGRMNRAALQRLFADHLPPQMIGSRLVLGLDVSSILRPDAHTSPTVPWCIAAIYPQMPSRLALVGSFPRWSSCPIR